MAFAQNSTVARGPRRRLAGLLAALCALVAGSRAQGEDEPGPQPPVPETLLVASVVSDPSGEATRLSREAFVAVASDDPTAAYAHFLALAEEHGETMIPVSVFAGRLRGRAGGALRWPARLVANHGLAGLPARYRDQLDAHWATHTQPLWNAVRRGDREALARLANEYPATRVGGRALLFLAEHDFEAGRHVRAARMLQRWLTLNAEADPTRRASVALREADALAQVDDAGALEQLQVLHNALRTVPVTAGGATTTLADRVSSHAGRSDVPSGASGGTDIGQIQVPFMLWSCDIADPELLPASDRSEGELAVRAGAWGRDGTLVLHEGRRVRRLDLHSGLERWRFPRKTPAGLHDPRDRYTSYDLPFRSVTAAGNRVLVVLGDPAATGRYTFLSQEYDTDQLGQECRTRLVCLDLDTGELVWMTGAADATHPVLGHAATGCASPPLVVGDRVYCLFARRVGATAFHLACLDLATGRPLWVNELATGESGRHDDRAGKGNRFTGPYVQSVPWGARPSLHAGEICVVPHAGFAAGVSATDGAVRWLRALPRYPLSVTLPASAGHNVRNVPMPWGDTWLIAPMDAPVLLSLAQGSGDLRWQRGADGADAPEWRDLLGVARDSRGRPFIRLSGWRPALMDPVDGALTAGGHLDSWNTIEGDPGGTALDMGNHVLRFAEGALQAQRWETETPDTTVPVSRAVEEPLVPLAGDLYRIGDVLVVVGLERVAALMQPPIRDLSAEFSASHASDEAGLAALMATGAALTVDAERMTAAITRAGRAPAHLQASVYAHIGAAIERAVAELDARNVASGGAAELEIDDASVEAWIPVAERLPMRYAGPALRRLAGLLFERDQDAVATRLLLEWIDRGDHVLVPLADTNGIGEAGQLRGGAMRGDLLAGAMLRGEIERPRVKRILEARELRVAERVRAAARGGEAALREAIRRAAGSRAAAEGRRRLMADLRSVGRHADAAAVAADLRLDPPWLDLGQRRLRTIANLQMEEAGWLAEAHDDFRARTLTYDLERWAPAALKDAAGRSVADLRDDLRRTYGWYPRKGNAGPALDVWRGLPEPENRDQVRSVEFLSLTGPGAHKRPQLVLLVRGLTAELWSLHTRRRIAAFQGADEGWFGGSLTSVDRWVPGGGIKVSSIVAGEPADLSLIQDGDWVRTWDGKPVSDLPTFMNLVASSTPGREIPIEVYRGGRRVLDRFTAGRRPAAQGRMLDYGPIWTEADGRMLLPGRTGLTWLDPTARTRVPLWTWREPGVVRRVRVLGGRAFVTIQRGLQHDLVVAVDLRTAREVWRHAVQGTITSAKPAGSGLWVQTVGPAHATLLDRHGGLPRARLRCFDFWRHEFRKNWTPAAPSDAAAGRGYVVSGSLERHTLSIVNTTTGATEHETSWSASSRRRSRYVNPQVSAGAFVAVIGPPALRVYMADPFGGAPRHAIRVDKKVVMTAARDYGSIDQDARIHVRGDRLFLVRVPLQGRHNVNVSVFGVDYDSLPREPTPAQSGYGGVLYMASQRRWIQGSSLPTRYVVDMEPYFEGIFVTAARLAAEHRVECWWVSALREDGPSDNVDVRLRHDEVQEARRTSPVRLGDRLLVPADRGADILRVQRSDR